MALRIIETNDPRVLEKIGRLRVEVWRQVTDVENREMGDSDNWLDRDDYTGIHWVVFDDDELVAAARLSIHESLEDAPYGHIFKLISNDLPSGAGKVASINRLVVLKSHQGRGISKMLDSIRIAKAIEVGASVIIALTVSEARTSALLQSGFHLLARHATPEDFGLQVKRASIALLLTSLPSLPITVEHGEGANPRS